MYLEVHEGLARRSPPPTSVFQRAFGVPFRERVRVDRKQPLRELATVSTKSEEEWGNQGCLWDRKVRECVQEFSKAKGWDNIPGLQGQHRLKNRVCRIH